jgi:hypothetical protein
MYETTNHLQDSRQHGIALQRHCSVCLLSTLLTILLTLLVIILLLLLQTSCLVRA